ncbi:MAG: FecR domain-containing protein [Rhodoblastus sp.]|nr:FecR domain-containing protein [Rhodoblastus sp.]
MNFRPLLLAAFLATLAGAAPAQTVGSVGAANQDASSEPPGGARRSLKVGAGVVQRERIRTDAQGSAQIAFKDSSALNIGRNSDVTIDKFVFDPASGAGQMTTSMTRGALRFVGGKVSHGNGSTIRTPAATIGVRGGVASIGYDSAGRLHVIHHYGVVSVTNGGGAIKLLRSGFETVVTDFNAPPSPPTRVDPGFLAQITARVTSSAAQRGGVKKQPTNSDASRFDIGMERLGGDTPNFDLPAARDNFLRGQTQTRGPIVQHEPNHVSCTSYCY